MVVDGLGIISTESTAAEAEVRSTASTQSFAGNVHAVLVLHESCPTARTATHAKFSVRVVEAPSEEFLHLIVPCVIVPLPLLVFGTGDALVLRFHLRSFQFKFVQYKVAYQYYKV